MKLANPWQALTDEERMILDSLGGEQGMWIRPSYIRAVKGNGSLAILLTQLVFRSKIAKGCEFSYPQADIESDTGLGPDAQRTAKAHLKRLKILRERRKGVPPAMYFRIDYLALIALLKDAANKAKEQPNFKEIANMGDTPSLNTGHIPSSMINTGDTPSLSFDKHEEDINKDKASAPRPRNEFADIFCGIYRKRFPDGLPYRPTKNDFIGLARLRTEAEESRSGWLTPEQWDHGVRNYFESRHGFFRIADLCKDLERFNAFWRGPLDQYGKPLELSKGNGVGSYGQPTIKHAGDAVNIPGKYERLGKA